MPMQDGWNRVKVVWLDPNVIIDVLNWCNMQEQDEPTYSYLRLPDDCAVPRDAKVVSVWFNHDRRCFGINVQHSSFDPVPPGDMVPELHPSVSWMTKVVKIPEPA